MTPKLSKADMAREARRSNQIVCPKHRSIQPAVIACCHVISGTQPAAFYVPGEPGRTGELLCKSKHTVDQLSMYCQQCAADLKMLPAPVSTAV